MLKSEEIEPVAVAIIELHFSEGKSKSVSLLVGPFTGPSRRSIDRSVGWSVARSGQSNSQPVENSVN